MKLNDKTTVKTLREMIGKKIRTRTSRATIEITDIELTKDETWFVGHEGSRKRRIKLEHISEIVVDKPEKAELKKRGIIERKLELREKKDAEKYEKDLEAKIKQQSYPTNPPETFPSSWL